MFPGKLDIVDLADKHGQNIRKHTFWWILGLPIICIIIFAQRWFIHNEYDTHLRTAKQQVQVFEQKHTELETTIVVFPITLLEQHQHKHTKLSLLLRLLQKHMPEDMRLIKVEWQTRLRIEGEAMNRENISPLRANLMEYGYFSAITLEQIRRDADRYTFVLLVDFAELVNLSLLRKELFQ